MRRFEMFVAALAIAICGCGDRGAPVHFIFPNGFRGEVQLVFDPSNGDEIRLIDGRYVYRLPESGILHVRSFAPFERWHEETAAFDDGTTVPQDYLTRSGPNGEAPELGKNAVVYHSGGLRQHNDEPPVMWSFVGTTTEYETWMGRAR